MAQTKKTIKEPKLKKRTQGAQRGLHPSQAQEEAPEGWEPEIT